jgi:hypothetical protein
MILIGERRTVDPNETWWQVNLSRGGETLVRFNSSAVENASIKDRSGCVAGGRLLLKFAEPGALECCKQGAQVSVDVGSAGVEEPTSIFRGTIDYVETRRETPAAPYQVELHVRGPGARLLDEGYRGELSGMLPEIIRQLCAAEPVVQCDDAPEPGDARAWIDAGSTFGVLQLLAASLGAVVVNDRREGFFAFTTRAAAFARMQKRGAQVVDGATMKNLVVREGVPIRGVASDDGDDES